MKELDSEKLKEKENLNISQYNKLLSMQKVLIDMDKEYSIKVINGNYELISDLFKTKTFKGGGYTSQELKFIRDVRSYIIKNEIHLQSHFQDNQLFAQDVHYVKVQRVPLNKVFKNVCEVDLDQAYWETAYQLGIINDDLYLRGSKGHISKKARLTALGSLAKKVYTYNFKGKKVVSKDIDQEPLLQNLWFTICKRVSDVMHEAIAELGRDFIFYWVDGIYFINKPENIQKVMGIFLSNGYNSKFKKINQIAFNEKGFRVNDYGDIIRDFSFPNYNKKGKKINYAESVELSNLANDIMNKDLDLLEQIKKNNKSKDSNE